MTTPMTSFISIIEEIAFFQGFTPEELDMLLEVGKWAKVPQGELIIHQGDQDLHMFILVQGRTEVVYSEKVVAVINSGDIFGEVGLMGKPRIAHVQSAQECLLLSFDANDLNELPLTLQVKFLRRVLDTLFARLQKANVQKWLITRDKSLKDKTRTFNKKP